MKTKTDCSICAVAIVKGEERFIEEWLVYHRLLGVNHFFLYDNDPELPLRSLLSAYESFVTVIDWPGDPTASWPGRNLQIKTYTHALACKAASYTWVTFLDPDEFIVLRKHDTLPTFLSLFENVGSVRLNWHVFGHNGYYENPKGLVTAALTRRMAMPSPRTKAITRTEAVTSIESAHCCRLKRGWRTVDANGQLYSEALYPGKTHCAHINHYQCRSFLTWMGRVRRGDVSFDRSSVPADHRWRFDEHLCLRQFVETVAKDRNELVDDSMLQFESRILTQLAVYSGHGSTDRDRPRLEPPNLSSTIYGSPTIPERRRRWLPGVAARFSDGLIRLNGWRLLRRLQRDRDGQ
jgi:hypothetical protein